MCAGERSRAGGVMSLPDALTGRLVQIVNRARYRFWTGSRR